MFTYQTKYIFKFIKSFTGDLINVSTETITLVHRGYEQWYKDPTSPPPKHVTQARVGFESKQRIFFQN